MIINGEYTVPMEDINQLKGHRSGALHGVKVATGRTGTAVAAKRNELKISTVWAAVHSTTKRRITTVYHLFDIFHLRRSVMKSIFNFFIIVGKDSL